jgi:HAD superfamily hydrolase (TIGR01450 family)
MNNPLSNIRHFALDMDGTLYKSETWINGAREFLRALRETNRDYVFLTNNSSKSKGQYLEKLSRMGLDTAEEMILTSGEASIHYLKTHYTGKKVFLLGNESLCREFTGAGICLDERNPDLLMTAFDTSLDYNKMQRLCDFVREGLPFLATHPDVNCPTETGLMPDIGAIHAFVHASAGRWPDCIIGKPHGPMKDYLFRRTGWEPEKTAAVGDRLVTDVALATRHGFTGVLVLSGATDRKEVKDSEIQPDFIFESVKEMIPYIN